MPNNLLAGVAPVTRRVRAFFAPVNRITGQPTLWDPGSIAAFEPDTPPAPWLDLGLCAAFTRTSGTRATPLLGGAPGVPLTQVRTDLDATVSLEFETWGKLQLALTAGVQQMNVLRTQAAAAANGSGGAAVPAIPINAGSTATALNLGPAAAGFAVGDIIAVDINYTTQLGFVGAGVSGGYVKTLATDLDYVRRITLNVGRVLSVTGNVLNLAAPLLAGAPVAGMQVSHVAGFCDREGGSFFQEWSALFLLDGEQGERIAFHYPRLQSMAGAAETSTPLSAAPLARLRLHGRFRAMPVKDASDGESILCFRSYLPGAMRTI